jgi:hypothetical protein
MIENWGSPRVQGLRDGRLHLSHGPIDLLIGVTGPGATAEVARAAAIARFSSILTELVADLPLLRCPLPAPDSEMPGPAVTSPVARRMVAACRPHAAAFITPMAAVAGSVAEEMAASMLAAAPTLWTLHINNGGDIAVYAAPGHVVRIGLVRDLDRAIPEGVVLATAENGIGGLATSGWRGRSFSRGIADAVTVVAKTASVADAAATVIANAVDAADQAITRAPAANLDPDTDLRSVLVTTGVGPLDAETVAAALAAGLAEARRLVAGKAILGAALSLQGEWRIAGVTLARSAPVVGFPSI